MKKIGIRLLTLWFLLTAPGVAMGDVNGDLIAAAERGDLAAVQEWVRQGAAIDARDARGRTALLAAVERDRNEVAAFLIGAGADVNAQDLKQDSPHLLAGANGNLEILKLTIEAGPDYTRLNRYGGTALIPASEHGYVDVVKALLATEVDVNHVNNLGWTALMEAILLSDGGPEQQAVVRLLVAGGADVNIPDHDGVTPLQHARRMGYREIARTLEAAGAH